jgi:hypothetical protein
VSTHNAQNWTASIVVGIEPKSAQNGGSGLGSGTGGDHRARRPDRLSDRCRGASLLIPAPGFTAQLAD